MHPAARPHRDDKNENARWQKRRAPYGASAAMRMINIGWQGGHRN